jgi:hypothetical protein
MGQMGGTFVRVTSDHEQALATIRRLLEERDRSWLAESPEHVTCDHVLRLHSDSDWLSIDGCPDNVVKQISVDLKTEIIELYAVDECHLRFRYTRHSNGEERRALWYDARVWTTVRGTPEPWETLILFSDRLMDLYRKHAPQDELRSVEDRPNLKEGRSIPWACDSDTVTQIARALGLPYDAREDSFSNEMRRETIRAQRPAKAPAKRWL